MLFADNHKKINTFLDILQQNVYFLHIDTTFKQSTSQNHIKRTQRKTNAKTFFNFAFAFVYFTFTFLGVCLTHIYCIASILEKPVKSIT
jgi:hypothetical protein